MPIAAHASHKSLNSMVGRRHWLIALASSSSAMSLAFIIVLGLPGIRTAPSTQSQTESAPTAMPIPASATSATRVAGSSTAPIQASGVSTPASVPKAASFFPAAQHTMVEQLIQGRSAPSIAARALLFGWLVILLAGAARRHHWIWRGHQRIRFGLYPDNSPKENGSWSAHLLPSQADVVQQCIHRILRATDARSNALVGLAAVWGGGKTTVIRALESQLDTLGQSGQPARAYIPVMFNAWREETQEDLHFKVVERIVLQPRVWPLVGPVLSRRLLRGIASGNPLTQQGWLASLREIRFSLKAQAKAAEQSMSAELSGARLNALSLDYQEDLERIVKALRTRGCELVLLIDEVERGTHACSQALLLLLRRSLDLPGLHIVVPYVPDVLDALVFEPFMLKSAELDSAAIAVLGGDPVVRQRARQRLATRSRSALDATAPAETDAPIEPVRGALAGEVATSTPPPAPKLTATANAPTKADAGTERNDLLYRQALLTEYMQLDEPHRRRLNRRMQEKYTAAAIDIPAPTHADLWAFVRRQTWFSRTSAHRVLADAVEAMLDGPSADERSTARAAAAEVPALCEAMFMVTSPGVAPSEMADGQVRAALAHWLGSGGLASPALRLDPGRFSWRSFEGELHRALVRWEADSATILATLRNGDWQALRLAGDDARAQALVALSTLIAGLVALTLGLMRVGFYGNGSESP